MLKTSEISLRQTLTGSGLEDIRIFDSLPSTNTHLMQSPFAAQAQPPVLCWALNQTAGRGRRGRTWLSEPGQALTFSLAFETPVPAPSEATTALSSLSPACGLSLAQALDTISPGVRVKWPNDLWRNGRKMAGILLEASARAGVQRVVIGVGVNLHWSDEDSPALTTEAQARAVAPQPAGGLFDQPATETQRIAALNACVRAICSVWTAWHASPQQYPDFSAWSAFDALAAQSVSLYNDQHLLATGTNAGVDRDGAFLLRQTTTEGQSALSRFEIGEVSLRHSVSPPTSETLRP